MLVSTTFLRLSFSIVLFFCAAKGIAQTPVVHTIKQGETLSALAKQYHTTVGDIMRFNGMNSTSKLAIGQAVKIPTSNATATTTVAPSVVVAAPATIAVEKKVIAKPEATNTAITNITYVVAKGDGLYSLAKRNNTTVEQLKAWNGLADNNIKLGQVLIVGKQNSTAAVAPVEQKSTTAPMPLPQEAPKATAPSKPIDTKVTEETVLTAPSATVTKKPEIAMVPASQMPTNNAPTVRQATVLTAPPANAPRKVTPEPTNTSESETNKPFSADTKYVEKEGFFAGYFNHKSNTSAHSGDAAIFKTISGWNDKKYYVLMNNVDQGTIVKVTYNNKSICAKVLGPLPEIKEDAGLLLRLSNAAAATLGVEDVRFNVTVYY